ncbi:MAG: outer membrane beta-barrel protein [Cyclobacteriaceae bacterium]|nr:outer membrane beta-barrel protein [Cyclobacteriaceae bacterium]
MFRSLLVLITLLQFTSVVNAQRSEVGFGLGTFNYTGDLVRTYNIKNSSLAGTIHYRSNLSNVVSFRATITAGQVRATEVPIDAFAAARNASFNTFLLETSIGFEYHFLNWRDVKAPMRYTPYIFAGLGLFGISGYDVKPEEYSNVQGTIPFGGGFKYIVNPKFYVAFEVGIRKTFFDYLDNISGGDPLQKNFQYGNPNDFDNYFFVGVTLTRTFYDIPCPKNPYK